jgi:ABC-2 type transport system permease protein
MSATVPALDRVPAPPAARQPPGSAAVLRALVARGLRDHRLAPLTWGGSLGALCALMAGLYPSMGDAIDRIMKLYPRNLLEAFGVSRIDSLEAWLHAEMFSLIVPLALAYFAARSATRLLVEAEERGHLDTLLAAPVERRVLVAGCVATTAVVLVEILAVIGAMPYLVGAIVGASPSLAVLLAGLAGVFALAIFFAGVAVLAAGLLHRSAAVTGVAAGLLALMYTLEFLGKAVSAASPLRYASAFRYYGAPMIDGFDPAAFAGLVVAGAALAAVGAYLFERRDVYAG